MIKVGDKRGELTVLRVVGKTITTRCSCGKFRTIYASEFMNYKHPSCGWQCATILSRRVKERAGAYARIAAKHVGTRYGSLVIESVDPARIGRRHIHVTARCDCGEAAEAALDDLRTGKKTTCGCRRIYIAPEWKLALYKRWGT